MISSSYINLVKLATPAQIGVSVWKLNFLTLMPAVGGKAQKLPLHRIDLGEICRDEVIAAALAGHHLKTTVHEGQGGTCAAEMDECGEILLLLRAWRCVRRAGKNRRDIAVQVHGG